MPYLIGTDEAGYGPNLGPLVVAATVWHVEEPGGELAACDLYERLQGILARGATAIRQNRWTIADSKIVYKSGQGLEALERNVLCALQVAGGSVTTTRGLWEALDPGACPQFDALPWHGTEDRPLPLAASAAQLATLCDGVTAGLQAARVQLVAVAATAVFPARFNQLVREYGSKGEALSRATLELVGRVLEPCRQEPVLVVCDKHGGRGRYQALLQRQFPDPLIEVVEEGLRQSVYRWGPATARREVQFRAKGEAFLPAALASMTAKYLRELSMQAFNEYWNAQVVGLRPTAGYPLDARRFKAEIAEAQQSLGISDHLLWRDR